MSVGTVNAGRKPKPLAPALEPHQGRIPLPWRVPDEPTDRPCAKGPCPVLPLQEVGNPILLAREKLGFSYIPSSGELTVVGPGKHEE